MAVNGTRYILEACLKHNTRKVVVTSSTSAIYQSQDKNQRYFTEEDWSDPAMGLVYD